MPFDRTTKTALTALVAILLAGFARPTTSITGMDSDLFWYRKMLWNREFDMVLAGDSRVLCAASPGAMKKVLPGRRIANFSFRLAGYSRSYTDRCETLLDPASRNPTIVFGVDPHSLTPNAARDVDKPSTWMSVHPWRPSHYNVEFESEFLWMNAQHPAEVRLRVWMAPFYNFFDRLHALDLAALFKRGHVYPKIASHDDGWFSVSHTAPDYDQILRILPELYNGNQASQAVIDAFVRRVSELRKRGIAVFGYVTPTGPLVEEVEARYAGFDAAAFEKQFTAAGGKWLAFPHGKYPTFDGHHLMEQGAVEFSGDLARAIAACEAAAPH